jgi:hypothetical protein
MKVLNIVADTFENLFVPSSACLKLRLHATICRVRFVFWRIKMSARCMAP